MSVDRKPVQMSGVVYLSPIDQSNVENKQNELVPCIHLCKYIHSQNIIVYLFSLVWTGSENLYASYGILKRNFSKERVSKKGKQRLR